MEKWYAIAAVVLAAVAAKAATVVAAVSGSGRCPFCHHWQEDPRCAAE